MKLNDLYEFCDRHKEIYCYGAGRYGRETFIHLAEKNMDILAFVVSKKSERNFVLGKPLIDISSINPSKRIGIIVAAGGLYVKDMIRELDSRGFNDYFVIEKEILNELEVNTRFIKRYPSNQFVNVLMYHRVANLSRDDYNISVTPRHFKEQMRFIKDNYPVLSFEEDWTQVSAHSIVITFDDGYADNFYNALPILKEYEIPAIFFVSTENIDTELPFWWDILSDIFDRNKEKDKILLGERTFLPNELMNAREWLINMDYHKRKEILMLNYKGGLEDFRVMNVGELRQIVESDCFSIGAHSVTHSSLKYESSDLQSWEIRESQNVLQNILQRDVKCFSFPFGDYTEGCVEKLLQMGFKKSCTTVNGLTDSRNLFLIPRNQVPNVGKTKFAHFLKMCESAFGDVL